MVMSAISQITSLTTAPDWLPLQVVDNGTYLMPLPEIFGGAAFKHSRSSIEVIEGLRIQKQLSSVTR
jgi:hypothetical protein